MGADYRTICKRTPIPAPCNGRTVEVGEHNINGFGLGYYCVFEHQKNGKTYQILFAHLDEMPDNDREHNQGDIIGLTGDTGTRIRHAHVEVWPDVRLLTDKWPDVRLRNCLLYTSDAADE